MEPVLESAKEVLQWWEENQYMTTCLGDGDEDNVFDAADKDMFARLKDSVERKENGKTRM